MHDRDLLPATTAPPAGYRLIRRNRTEANVLSICRRQPSNRSRWTKSSRVIRRDQGGRCIDGARGFRGVCRSEWEVDGRKKQPHKHTWRAVPRRRWWSNWVGVESLGLSPPAVTVEMLLMRDSIHSAPPRVSLPEKFPASSERRMDGRGMTPPPLTAVFLEIKDQTRTVG